jgi:hypothetical protein
MGTTPNIADELRSIGEELDDTRLIMLAESLNPTHPKGTIVKAKPDNGRFQDTSAWVSNGDGTYKHITGERGLTATFPRLHGFVSVVYSA